MGSIDGVASFGEDFIFRDQAAKLSRVAAGHELRHMDVLLPPTVRQLASLAEDREGQLWISAAGALFIWSQKSGVRQLHASASLSPPSFEWLQPSEEGMWLADAGVRIEHRSRDGRVISEVALPAGEGVEAMRMSPAKTLWIANAYGIKEWNEQANTLSLVRGIDRGQHSVDLILTFAFDGEDAFWLHRIGKLERYERTGDGWKLVRVIGMREGFPSIAATAIACDTRGRVWLGSERGLYRWDPARGRMRRYGLADGLSSQEFGRTGLALHKNGALAAVAADGSVVMIDTNAEDPLVAPPKLVLDRFDVRRGADWMPMPGRALQPTDTELRIRWRLLSFHDAANDRYFTRLDGHDAQWVAHSLDEGGQRVFTNLAPGNYTLRVRAQDSQGRNIPEQSVSFEVLPAWWQTRSAWLLYVVLTMLAIAGAVWLYRRRLLRLAAWQQAQREHQFAQEASLAKTRFLATLGHEVRTPITGVLGMSELLLDTSLDPTQRSYTQAIHGAGKHLVRLVNDALDLSRIESGKLDLLAEPFDLHRLVADVAQLAGPLARRKSLVFESSMTPSVPQGVCGDASRVRQILLNLLGNAIKFTQAGRVWLKVDASAGEVWLEVGDTGPGLNAEQQSRLFRRFEQAEGARTAATYGGSGLGLAICQELASLMGGSIAVDSTPGQGARFRVCLPLPPAEISQQQEVALASSPARRVLLVEDDDTVAQVIAGLLRAQGHTVHVVPHSLAALSELAVERFEVALVDLDLPGMDGLSLVRHMRAQGITFPIVAITARADAGAIDSAHAAGCDRFMRKPVSGQMLAALMADCIALNESDRELAEHSAV